VRGIFGYLAGMLRKSISGFVEPCRPSKPTRPPSGPEWVHEVKLDGFRLLVRRDGARVRCFTRGGFDWADRFPAVLDVAHRIRAQSFFTDGEALQSDGVSLIDDLAVLI
jgi:bifunctional non-homologous end joining protein LigD